MLGYTLDFAVFSGQKFWKVEKLAALSGLTEAEIAKAAADSGFELSDGVFVVSDDVSDFEARRFGLSDVRALSFRESERLKLVYLLVFAADGDVSVEAFQALFGVSRNTILSDVKQLKLRLSEDSIALKFSRKQGYTLSGNAGKLLSLAFRAIHSLDNQALYLLSKFLNRENPQRVASSLSALTESGIKMPESRLTPTLLLFSMLENCARVNAPTREALLFSVSDGSFRTATLDFLYRIAFEIMESIMRLAALEFEDFTKTFMALLTHLTPAYFRIKYELVLENPLTDRIHREYPELWQLTEKALEPLSAATGPISADELAYFVMLFGSESHKRARHRQYSAVVLCVNGISSSLIMRKRLEALFPMIEFALATDVASFAELPVDSYDMLFSTLSLPTEKPIYLMSPLPEAEEARQLYNQVVSDFALPGYLRPSADSLVKSLAPYLAPDADRAKVAQLLARKLALIPQKKENSPLMLSDLLTEKSITFAENVPDWETAITLAAQPLLDSEKITRGYTQAIISRVKEFGAYIDLGHGVALPHARPEDGVNKIGMSLLKLAQPVNLLDDPAHAVQILIVLAASDNESHLHALSELTSILSDKNQLASLLSAEKSSDIQKIIQKGETND
ncbi:MAG: PTS sugar transporter subunit IIA [Streptococcaceae bacterium]|jgi:mannitol/fructose-specific phosphotransferase system IIA component (Ntr-type)/transcriptional antiterminator|nr:PTS sugar transporter subunit IIA [Streptococcaceae bacterium]